MSTLEELLLGLPCRGKMSQRKGLENGPVGPGFVLLAFCDRSSLQGLCFMGFLLIYLMALAGNSPIALLTVGDSGLLSPMGFFLRNLSFLEVCCTSVPLPKMLVCFVRVDGRISLLGCAAQLCFLVLLGSTESLLLAAMAYDRSVAMGHPLHCPLAMSRGLCTRLGLGSWGAVTPVQGRQTYQLFTLPFCASHGLPHFFWDVPPLLDLACAHTLWNQVVLLTTTLGFVILPFCFIVLSDMKIVRAILRIPSVLGRHKAFSTCSSHLGVLTFFCGSATAIYLKGHSRDSGDPDKYSALFYTDVTPMFNPLIYSLRNKEVKMALKRLLCVGDGLAEKEKDLYARFKNNLAEAHRNEDYI